MLQEKQEEQTEKKNRIPIIRERLLELKGNLSNVDFAKKLGLSRQTVGFYINGDRIPDAETLKKICQCCNVSADYILGLSEDPAIDNCAVDELDLTPRYNGGNNMIESTWRENGADGRSFGQRLENLIEINNITANKLAKETGISQSAISNYLSSKVVREPNCTTICTLAKYFSVSSDYLLGLTSDPNIKKSAVDELDLTPRYIGAITRRKSQDNPLQWAITRRILETAELKIAAAVYDCVIAQNAYDEYKRVFMMYVKEQSDHFCFGSGNKYNIIHQKTAKEITKKMDSEEYSLELRQNLSRQIRYSDEESLITPSVADMARLRLMDTIDCILDSLGKDEKIKALFGLSEPPKYEITYDEEMTRNAQEYEKHARHNRNQTPQ